MPEVRLLERSAEQAIDTGSRAITEKATVLVIFERSANIWLWELNQPSVSRASMG